MTRVDAYSRTLTQLAAARAWAARAADLAGEVAALETKARESGIIGTEAMRLEMGRDLLRARRDQQITNLLPIDVGFDVRRCRSIVLQGDARFVLHLAPDGRETFTDLRMSGALKWLRQCGYKLGRRP